MMGNYVKFLVALLVIIAFYTIYVSYKQPSRNKSCLKPKKANVHPHVACIPRMNYSIDQCPYRTGGLHSPQYENMRRRINNHLEEMWYVVSTAYNNKEKEMPDSVKKTMKDMIYLFDEIRTHAVKDFETLINMDGAKELRDKIANETSEKVQKDIYRTQNPKDCNSARKIVCSLERKNAGFGAQVHNVLNCFITAYATNRVAIIDGSKGWIYSKKGWNSYFRRSSDSCWTYSGSVIPWDEHEEDDKVISFPTHNEFDWFAQPQRVPREFYSQIRSFHGYPYIWWMGQMIKYFCSYLPEIENSFKQVMQDVRFKKPIVGVQIRRTDKLPEVKYHDLDEYMYWVKLYYKRLQQTGTKFDKERIFLATEVPEVFAEAKKKYGKEYEILGNIAKKTDVVGRYSDEGLYGILLDMEILSETDFLVCTFSSNVCRFAFEKMNFKNTDALDRYHSIDTGYIISQIDHQTVRALSPHKAKDETEISFEAGDRIQFMYIFDQFNMWNGSSRGKHLKTQKTGFFPSFKVELDDLVVDYHSHYEERGSNSTKHENIIETILLVSLALVSQIFFS